MPKIKAITLRDLVYVLGGHGLEPLVHVFILRVDLQQMDLDRGLKAAEASVFSTARCWSYTRPTDPTAGYLFVGAPPSLLHEVLFALLACKLYKRGLVACAVAIQCLSRVAPPFGDWLKPVVVLDD